MTLFLFQNILDNIHSLILMLSQFCHILYKSLLFIVLEDKKHLHFPDNLLATNLSIKLVLQMIQGERKLNNNFCYR